MNWEIFFVTLISFILGAIAGVMIVAREIKKSLNE